jgi:hypothetical protein
MFRERLPITPANAYLLVRQVVQPGLSRELRQDTPWERRKKKLLGAKAVEQVNTDKLLDGTRRNVTDILNVIDQCDPAPTENDNTRFTEPVQLDYGETATNLTAEMLLVTRKLPMYPDRIRRQIMVHLKGTGANEKPIDTSLDFQVFSETDVRTRIDRNTVLGHEFVPISEVFSMGVALVELYDITGRVANGVEAARSAGTLAVRASSTI